MFFDAFAKVVHSIQQPQVDLSPRMPSRFERPLTIPVDPFTAESESRLETPDRRFSAGQQVRGDVLEREESSILELPVEDAPAALATDSLPLQAQEVTRPERMAPAPRRPKRLRTPSPAAMPQPEAIDATGGAALGLIEPVEIELSPAHDSPKTNVRVTPRAPTVDSDRRSHGTPVASGVRIDDDSAAHHAIARDDRVAPRVTRAPATERPAEQAPLTQATREDSAARRAPLPNPSPGAISPARREHRAEPAPVPERAPAATIAQPAALARAKPDDRRTTGSLEPRAAALLPQDIRVAPAATRATPGNAANEAPTIHISIGRVEVRAVGADAPVRKPPPQAQTLGLEDYLQRRNAGGAR